MALIVQCIREASTLEVMAGNCFRRNAVIRKGGSDFAVVDCVREGIVRFPLNRRLVE